MKLQLDTAKMPDGYTICDNRIFNSNELTADAKYLYIWLTSKPADFRFFGAENIARLTNMPYSAVRNAVKSLVDFGLLKKSVIEHGGKKGREIIFDILNFDNVKKLNVKDIDKKELKDTSKIDNVKIDNVKILNDSESPNINTQKTETIENREFKDNSNFDIVKNRNIINKDSLTNKEETNKENLKNKEELKNKDEGAKIKKSKESQSEKNITNAFNAKRDEIHHFTLDDVLEFAKHRDEIKKPITELAAKKTIEKLIEYGIGAYDSIQNSIMNGWQGIFEPKKINAENSAFAREKQRARAELSSKYATSTLDDRKPKANAVFRYVKSNTAPEAENNL